MKYIGVKIVDAELMTSEEFNVLIDRKARDGEDQNEEGYCVTYPGDGYKGWCPKAVFEAANYPVPEGDRLTTDDVHAFVPNANGLAVAKLGKKTAVVQATCLTGFEITKSAACVSEENYDEKKGMEIAMTHIENDLWGHLGFVLQWALNGLKRG